MKKVTAMLFSMAVGLNAVSMAAKAKASEEQETDVLLIGERHVGDLFTRAGA
ncbi:Malate:quinone oxidoreductase [Escherichia coli]|nr:Malate:quinone oxidoreductase [Escherichia coli]